MYEQYLRLAVSYKDTIVCLMITDLARPEHLKKKVSSYGLQYIKLDYFKKKKIKFEMWFIIFYVHWISRRNKGNH